MPFMRGLRITGGNRLSGTIAAHGAKNAVLPILAATVLCSRSEIKNCPNLSDVAVSCHILRHLGLCGRTGEGYPDHYPGGYRLPGCSVGMDAGHEVLYSVPRRDAGPLWERDPVPARRVCPGRPSY